MLRISHLVIFLYKSPALVRRELSVDAQDQFPDFNQVNGTDLLLLLASAAMYWYGDVNNSLPNKCFWIRTRSSVLTPLRVLINSLRRDRIVSIHSGTTKHIFTIVVTVFMEDMSGLVRDTFTASTASWLLCQDLTGSIRHFLNHHKYRYCL